MRTHNIQPARTVPTREEIAAVTHLYEIDENDHLMPRTRWEIADAVLALIGQRETKDVYELAAERIGTESTWTVDAREALGLTRTVPTRGEIARALSTHHYSIAYGGCACGADFEDETETLEAEQEAYNQHAADAILALLAGQPTVAEVKAQALEEFAEVWATGEWSDWFLAENVTCDVSAVQATDKALRERAQQIREEQ